jgi:hypothetical protein
MQHFLVAYDMCNYIKQVAKEKISSISYTNVGWLSFFGDNLQGFQFNSQDENQKFSHKLITFLKTCPSIFAQMKTSF